MSTLGQNYVALQKCAILQLEMLQEHSSYSVTTLFWYGCDGSKAYPGTISGILEVHPGWYARPFQNTMHTHFHNVIHTLWQVRIQNPPTIIYWWKPMRTWPEDGQLPRLFMEPLK